MLKYNGEGGYMVVEETFYEELKDCLNVYDLMVNSYAYMKQKKLTTAQLSKSQQETFNSIHNLIEEFTISNIDFHSMINKIEAAYYKKLTLYNLYEIIQCCDEYKANKDLDNLPKKKQSNMEGFTAFAQYDNYGLNTNYKEKHIAIFPKREDNFVDNLTKNIHKKCKSKRRKVERETDIFGLKNLIIYDESLFDSYHVVQHNYTKSEKMYERINTSNYLRISTNPMIAKDLNEIMDIQYKGNYFSINGIKEELNKSYYQHYFNNLDHVLKTQSDLVILPEMVVSDSILKDLPLYIMNSGCQEQIIISGTMSRKDKNECSVFDEKGHLLFVQNKHNPFVLKKENSAYLETLSNDQTIHILDLGKIGRLCVLICKDVRDNCIDSIMRQLKINLLCAPAFSPDLDIITTMENLTKDIFCVSVLSNCCSAYKSKDVDLPIMNRKIGAVLLPAMKADRRDFYCEYYSMGENCLSCNEYCYPYVFNIDGKETMSVDGKTTVKVSCKIK